jgi:hypothetical protein
MFLTIRRIFSRIRFILGGVRSAVYGIAMVSITWIVALPASEAEIARLNLEPNASADAEGLRHYRMAKLLLLVGSERTFSMIAERSGTGITGGEFQLALQIAANGEPVQTPPTPQSGAKFVSARSN